MQYCVIPQIFVSCLRGSQLHQGNYDIQYMAAEKFPNILLVVHLERNATTDDVQHRQQMEKTHVATQEKHCCDRGRV